jgi:hypothetical protein
MHLKHFLKDTTAKTSAVTIIIILAMVVVGYMVYTGKLDLGTLGLGITTGDGGSGVDVNKKLQFTWTARWSGTVANAKTFYIYDANHALRETLTTAATGIVATGQNYPSGTQLYVKYDDTNNQIWYPLIVPQMGATDAESSTYNDISLEYFAIGTYTTDSLRMLGLAVGDAEQINMTGNATTSPTFVYTLTNTGADNTGLLESYDPVYSCAWDVWVTGRITGDNASQVIVNGADYVFNIGTDTYFAEKVSATALSKWKVGSSYVAGYEGTSSCSWSLDLSGFTATSAATMQINVYECADPSYAMSHAGNFGPDKVLIAEQTVTMVDI